MTVADLIRPLDAAVVSGRAEGALDRPCTGIAYDSRQVTPGAIFVALRGRHADGLAYAQAAAAAGAACVVAESPAPAEVRLPSIQVPDARLALAILSAAFYEHPSHQMQVVGITGTNGKTTTAYLVRSILEAAGLSCGLMGTVTYALGGRSIDATRTTPEAPDVQAYLREMVSTGCRAAVMEVSSHALALQRVAGIRFAAGVFTNLTRDHLDFHESMDDYFAAKRRLFEMLPESAPAVVNADDPRGPLLVQAVRRPITFGIHRSADVAPGPLSYALSGLDFEVRLRQGTIRARSALVGKPNVYNILAAAAVTAELGVPLAAIETGLARLSGVPGRFEVVSGAADDVTVVVDYAHTDEALRNLLETARPMATRRLITVIGAGGDRDRTKRPLMGMVAARLSDVVVITSDNPRNEDPLRIIEEVRRGAESEARQGGAQLRTEVDRRTAILGAVGEAGPGDLVLLAGKGHEKYQEIGGQTLPFDDVAVAREALEARRPTSRAV